MKEMEKRLDANEFTILDLKKDKQDLQNEIENLKKRKDIIVN